MLTIDTYYNYISKENLSRQGLPKRLQKGWDYINQITRNGISLDTYHANKIVKRTIDLYLEKLATYLKSKGQVIKTKMTSPDKKERIKKQPLGPSEPKKIIPKSKRLSASIHPKMVETFSIELRFLKRFLNLDQQAKTKRQIRFFLNALQRAIIEKKIRKNSKYAKEIERLQNDLMTLLGNFKTNDIMQVLISKRKQNEILKVLGKESEIPSVKLIREYISLQGKSIPTKSAKQLHNKIGRKLNAGVIGTRDRYYSQINQILSHLRALVEDNPIGGELVIESRDLNGLEEIESIPDSVDSNRIPDDMVVNSMDLVKMKFDKLDFKKKWFDFIGNPTKRFNAMIFGRPKFGKSIMALDFAGYLAGNHGTVLYIAKEEGIDEELRKKLESVAHPDLDAVASIPENLDRWDFIFFDSVNKLRLSPQNLEDLRERHPEKSFVSIFQTTKEGSFRGSQEFMHDMDIVIEVPEKGIAVQTGRYNQGGELAIFKNRTLKNEEK